jgi:hypothetical protein
VKLWWISQHSNEDYDTYSDAVVAAENEESARNLHPAGYYKYRDGRWWGTRADGSEWEPCNSWSAPDQVTAEYIGDAKKGTKTGVICASFHAG